MTASEVIPNLWVGDMADAQKFKGVVLCVHENHENVVRWDENSRWMTPFSLNMEDATMSTTPERLDEIARYIHTVLSNERGILVHCGAGLERSPLVVAWYLRWRDRLMENKPTTIHDAYNLVEKARPEIFRRAEWIVTNDPQGL